MHDYLRGSRTEETVRSSWSPASYTMREDWDKIRRHHPPVADASERASSLQVIEDTYPDDAARTQAARCLRCNVNTVFDTEICVSCTGCVDVCPENLIRLTGLAELCKTTEGSEWVSSVLAISPEELQTYDKRKLDSLGGVMLKDETTCIRCGLCASRCPSNAITMQRFDFRRICVSHPELNPKLKQGPHVTQSPIKEGDGQASSTSPAQERP
jgi:ferredoxin